MHEHWKPRLRAWHQKIELTGAPEFPAGFRIFEVRGRWDEDRVFEVSFGVRNAEGTGEYSSDLWTVRGTWPDWLTEIVDRLEAGGLEL